jgi:hypothetical protein
MYWHNEEGSDNLVASCQIFCESGPRKRRFSLLQEKICEKIDTTSLAGSYNHAKMMRLHLYSSSNDVNHHA